MLKISIITVVYNSESTIAMTMESVLLQTYSNIEYILIDGLSSDNTLEIIKNYEKQFNGRMRWISEPDKGIYDAMNKGISMATGDIIGMLNSDDIYVDKNVLSDIANVFESHSIECTYGNLYFVQHSNINKIVRSWESSQYTPGAFRKGWHPAHPTFYVKRQCYNKYGLYDCSLKVSADFELMLRFLEKQHISNLFLNRYFVKMRIGGESTGSLKKIIIGNYNIIKAFHKNNIRVSPFYPIMRLAPKIINKIRHLKQ